MPFTPPFLAGLSQGGKASISILLCLCIGACSNAAPSKNPNAGNNPAGTNWIVGDWEGTYNTKDSEDGGSGLREETLAKAHFVSQDNKVGTFRIDLPLLNAAYIEGSFREFQSESLTLQITKSTVSAIGKEGVPTSLRYELIGEDLLLYNDRVVLKLFPEAGAGNSGSDSGGDSDASEQSPLVGTYRCADTNSRIWTLVVESDTAFHIDIRQSGGPAIPLTLSGSVSIQEPEADANQNTIKADLLVAKSNERDGASIGTPFQITRFADDNATLERFEKDDSILVESLQCTAGA